MKRVFKKQCWPIAVFLLSTMMITGCDQNDPEAQDIATLSASSNTHDQPIVIKHRLGEAVISHTPQRVAALDMNEVDLLDQLGVTVAGMPKDFVPGYLSDYKNDPNIMDLGAIVQPNMERVYALKPDLILISPLQTGHYQALSELSPTLPFDVNYQDSGSDHFDIVKNHLLTLGRIFDKDAQAKRVVDSLTAKVKSAQSVIKNRPEKAMIVIHNNGAYRFLGEKSRYGFVFEALGVKSIKSPIEAGLHGQPISSEFIYENNPDILYVLDRTAVMERHAGLTSDTMDNPLLRQTNAWKNQRVIFVDSEAWYIAGAGVSSLNIIIDDVLKGFRHD